MPVHSLFDERRRGEIRDAIRDGRAARFRGNGQDIGGVGPFSESTRKLSFKGIIKADEHVMVGPYDIMYNGMTGALGHVLVRSKTNSNVKSEHPRAGKEIIIEDVMEGLKMRITAISCTDYQMMAMIVVERLGPE